MKANCRGSVSCKTASNGMRRRLVGWTMLACLVPLWWLAGNLGVDDPGPTPTALENLMAGEDNAAGPGHVDAGLARVSATPLPADRNPETPATLDVPDQSVVLAGSVRCGGEPVPAVSIMVVGDGRNSCVSDDAGEFRLPNAVVVGTPVVLLVTCKRYLSAEVKIMARNAVPIQIELARAPTISGVLADMGGKPVEGYRLQVLDEAGRTAAVAVTDAGGRFDLCSPDPQTRGWGMIVEGLTGGLGLLAERPRVPWGTEDLTLRVLEHGNLTIRVQRASDGTPVAPYEVCLLHAEHHRLQGWGTQKPVRSGDASGVVQIRCIPGPVTFIVIPEDPALQSSGTQAVRVLGGGTLAVDVKLEAGTSQRVLVHDRLTGEGLAGAAVRLVLGSTGDSGRTPDATLPVVSAALGLEMLTWPRIGIMAKAAADETGKAVIRTQGLTKEAWIECEHDGYQSVRMPLMLMAGDQELRIAMDRGRTVQGRVDPLSIRRFGPHVRTRQLRDGKELLGKWVAVDVDSGMFSLAIDHREDVRLDLALRLADGVPVLAARELVEVPRDPGIEAGPLVIDASRCIPGVAVGNVFVDGKPAARVRLHRPLEGGAAGPGWASEALVGEDGAFRVEPVLAGDWLFAALTDEEVNSGSYLPRFVSMGNVQPGQIVQIAASVTTATLELVVCAADGVPLSEGQRVSLSLQRCPARRETALLGPGGVLRRGGLLVGEAVVVQAVGGAQDKRRGAALVGDARVLLR